MAKIGRYSAQRRKVEDVTASKTLTTADCGTYFTCGGAAATLTLPTVADCGPGWWAEFWVNDASQATTIQAQGTNLILGWVLTVSDNDPSVNINPPTAPASGTDTVTLTGDCLLGDFVRIWCDGTNYFMEGQSRIVDAITATTE